MSKLLCPPLNQEFKMMGKKTSDTFARFRVSVEHCNKTIDPACVNTSEFNSISGSVTEFSLAIPFINTKINPDK